MKKMFLATLLSVSSLGFSFECFPAEKNIRQEIVVQMNEQMEQVKLDVRSIKESQLKLVEMFEKIGEIAEQFREEPLNYDSNRR